MARSLGIDDRITWLGPQPQEAVLAHYRSADLFVLASRIAADGDRDGLPNVLMEAQSQGLACVSTRVSAIPELIVDGETGLLVPPDDDSALAEALARLIRNPALRHRLGVAGRKRRAGGILIRLRHRRAGRPLRAVPRNRAGMRIAFYAPMKPPDHPVPSGDREMARLLIAALGAAGHEVSLASSFRSYDGDGDARRQQRLQRLGEGLAQRLIRRYRRQPPAERPALWFTYHLYHKAPDWLGPAVSRALAIPYVVAEASSAPKQAAGPWAAGHRAAAQAIAAADLIIGLNRDDEACVRPLMSDGGRYRRLPPFLDASAFAAAARHRKAHRRALLASQGLDDDETPLLLTVAMMRHGDKLASYRILGEALSMCADTPWRLAVAGDGPARPDVESALAGFGGRVLWLGARDHAAMPSILAAADICLWPAINEAYGMALLEAQAAGLPVVAGNTRGVPDVVDDGITGLLAPPGDVAAFADAVRTLLSRPDLRERLGTAAQRRIMSGHDLPAAAACLDRWLRECFPA